MTEKEGKTYFEKVKSSIDEALEEIKTQSPELYEHLKKSIIMDKENDTFMYDPKSESLVDPFI
jgi:hypothetical protein